MVIIKPFKGLLYNKERIKNIERVVAPPYDVISPQEQIKLYQRSPYNIVRLILGKEFSNDSPSNNRYTRAADYFTSWFNENILRLDQQNSFYIYGQDYKYDGKKITRYGLMALMKLEEAKSNRPLPHELTSRKPKEDRFKLLEAVKANLCPIFALFPDDKKIITQILIKQAKTMAIFDFKGLGVKHRLWRVSDKKIINKIKKLLKPKSIFIADGHHRYEVALSFRKVYNYVMVYLAGLDENYLTILPTHRLIKLPHHISNEKILKKLNKFFEVKKAGSFSTIFKEMKKENKRKIFGLFLGSNNYFTLTLDNLSKKHSNAKILDNLDVSVLHNLVLKKIFKVESNKFNSKVICYIRDAGLALKLVKARKYDLAFFLKPTKLQQVKDIALAGKKMPHKSTYFYPKPLSGLVINKFSEDIAYGTK